MMQKVVFLANFYYTSYDALSDINECDGSPCQNSGSCSNTPGSYTCDCSSTGFVGPNCGAGKFVSFTLHPFHTEQIKMQRPRLIFSQSDYLIRVVDQVLIFNDKQCKLRSVTFFRSQLIWICTVCKDRAHPVSAGPGLPFKLTFTFSSMFLLEAIT